MSERISGFEVGFLIATLAVAITAAWLIQPLVHGNSQAIGLLATVFSILAGLLIGIVTLLSDASLIPGETWRGAYLAKRTLQRRLHRHRVLFLVYLATLLLILASVIVPTDFINTALWLERLYVFLGTVGFSYSLGCRGH